MSSSTSIRMCWLRFRATAAAMKGLGLAQDTLIEAGLGDVAAQRAVRDVQTARQSQFQGGGGAAETQQGVTGLRRASPRVQ